MKHSFILILSILLFSACAPRWHWEATSFAEIPFAKAEMECKFEGEKALLGYPSGGNVFIMVDNQSRIYKSCMISKGFVVVKNK